MTEMIDLPDLTNRILAAAAARERFVVALAGPPASGKSTLACQLATRLPMAAVLPMDGFHLDNDTLSKRGLLDRKGSPDTFDIEGFKALVQRLKRGGDTWVPTFDRTNDCVVPEGSLINGDIQTIIVEGNYLMLDASGWRDLQQHWDITIMLEVPQDVLERRLIKRWRDHGLSLEQANSRARSNDLPNALLVNDRSLDATFTLMER